KAINEAYSKRLTWGSGKGCPLLGCVGVWKLPPLHPQELSSPARKPTTASLAHCATRSGCRSCSLVCWNAGLMASTAEIGKQAPRKVLRNWQQGTANWECGQMNLLVG